MPRGRISKLDYLRPEIIASFLEGKTGEDILDITGTGLTQPITIIFS